ncbi:MAG: site-specific integrase [Terriglobales bacterium]|jgi:integrase
MARQRGSGSIYQQKNSAVFWVSYYRNGKQFRESTRTTDRTEASNFLRKRLGEIVTGTFYGPKSERITVGELGEDFLRDYRVNAKRSLYAADIRWKRHLQPFFGHLRAVDISTDLLCRYVDERQKHGAANATINRELAALKRMFHLGYRCTPPKVNRVPSFPRLAEDNARIGFLEDMQCEKLLSACPNLWFRSLVEVGRTYGWRIGELLKLRVKQVDLLARSIRLEPGTTKNREGREVTMTDAVHKLLSQCLYAKNPDAFVFTRSDGSSVRDIRKTWMKACCAAGVGHMLCGKCGKVIGSNCECSKTERRPMYRGLIFHDLRRTAARNLRRAGIAEGVIMKIGGWRTRSVFERYAIVAQSDIQDAIRKLQDMHSFNHSSLPEPAKTQNPTSVN